MTRASSSSALLPTTPTGSCWAISPMKEASQSVARAYHSDLIADAATNEASPHSPTIVATRAAHFSSASRFSAEKSCR
jgi:hypothetical protein